MMMVMMMMMTAPVLSSEDGTLPGNLPISGRVASHNPLPTLNNSHQKTQSAHGFSPFTSYK